MLEFEVFKVDIIKKIISFVFLFLVPLLLYYFLISFGLVEIECRKLCAILFFLFFVFFVFFKKESLKIYSTKVVLSLKKPLNLTIIEVDNHISFEDIDRWDFAFTKDSVCIFRLRNAGERVTYYFHADESFNGFLEQFKKQIKEYNADNEFPIKNLRKEFYESDLVKSIFILIYSLNFIFIALWIYEYPLQRFGICLCLSIVATIGSAIMISAGKGIDS